MNRHKSFRRSVATLGRPLEQLQSSSYQEKKKFNPCPPFVLIDTPYRRTGRTPIPDLGRPILPTCPKLLILTVFGRWNFQLGNIFQGDLVERRKS